LLYTAPLPAAYVSGRTANDKRAKHVRPAALG
jgi:hypothetical protein